MSSVIEYEDNNIDQLLDEHYENEEFDENVPFDIRDFLSKPIKSTSCTIDENIIRLQYPLSNKMKVIDFQNFTRIHRLNYF